MIQFWEATPYPFEIQAGDVLFLAGCITAQSIPWEHVAIAAESKRIESPNDLLLLRTYGLPESVEAHAGRIGMDFSDGRRWHNRKPIVLGQIGSTVTAWNLGGRVDGVGSELATFMLDCLAYVQGSVEFRYTTVFKMQNIFTSPFETNCLGFVCSLFEHVDLHVVEADCPKYESPYEKYPGERDYPSPGHLAFALDSPREAYPYKPNDRISAEANATASATLRRKVRTAA